MQEPPNVSKKEQGKLAKIKGLYATHWADLCRYIGTRFGAPPEPEDIAQTAFIKFSEYHDKNPVDNPKAFLFRIASNLVTDYHRSPKNVLATEEETEAFKAKEKSDVWSPEPVLMGRQEAQIVEKVIMSLSERDRAFLLMNRLENMTYTEIAKQANMSRSGVQKIIMQALEKCSKALKKATAEEQAPFSATQNTEVKQ